MPKEKPPELKSSLTKVAEILAKQLLDDANSGTVDLDKFRLLCAWYKIEKGIDGDETEGSAIHGIAAKLATDRAAPSRKRAAAADTADDDATPTGGGPTTTATLDRIRSLTKGSDERGNAGGVARNSNGSGQQGSTVALAFGRGPSVGMGRSRSDDSEDDSDGDI